MSALAGDDAIFRIKHVSYRGKAVPILMQNLNGPCPLLAISNALLLQQKIAIHQDLAYIDFRQLIHLVGDYLVQSNPPHPDPDMQANQQQQIADALAVLPKLGRGLDVNVRFQKVGACDRIAPRAACATKADAAPCWNKPGDGL
jgi:hypothetical protein